VQVLFKEDFQAFIVRNKAGKSVLWTLRKLWQKINRAQCEYSWEKAAGRQKVSGKNISIEEMENEWFFHAFH
jgi:phage-related protein